jgi:hypothetical protein
VTLRGQFTSSTGVMYCKFGTFASTLATLTTSTRVLCDAPASPASTATVPVEVSINDVQFTTNAVPYEYRPDAAVSALSVTAGPEGGLTLVTVTGAQFVNTSGTYNLLRCRFDTTVVEASFVSATRAACFSPPHDVDASLFYADVPVSVSNNEFDFTVSSATYRYLAQESMFSIWPPNVPVPGGATVTIYGANMVGGALLRCRFGTLAPQAVSAFVTSTHIECAAPQHPPARVLVQVSNNAQDYVTLGRRATLDDDTEYRVMLEYLLGAARVRAGADDRPAARRIARDGARRQLCALGAAALQVRHAGERAGDDGDEHRAVLPVAGAHGGGHGVARGGRQRPGLHGRHGAVRVRGRRARDGARAGAGARARGGSHAGDRARHELCGGRGGCAAAWACRCWATGRRRCRACRERG